ERAAGERTKGQRLVRRSRTSRCSPVRHRHDGGPVTALQERVARVGGRMKELGVDGLLLSLGADLPWLTGYEAMPLERLTMLVLPVDDMATLVLPALEAPRVELHRELFSLRPWSETEDPVTIVADLVGGRRMLAVSDR